MPEQNIMQATEDEVEFTAGPTLVSKLQVR